MADIMLLDEMVGELVKVQVMRPETNPPSPRATLTIKNKENIGDKGTVNAKGKEADAEGILKVGTELFTQLVRQLRHKGLDVVMPEAQMIGQAVEPKNAFLLTATITVGDEDNQELIKKFEQAFKKAKTAIALQRYGTTSDKKGGELAGHPLTEQGRV